MYTLILLLILFLIVIFGTLLYFKIQNQKQVMLEAGRCPSCGSERKRFEDESSGVLFEVSPIESRILKNHGCSGIVEIEYICKSCGVKEIHNSVGNSCCGL